MIVARTLEEWRDVRSAWKAAGDSVGFVPTMGALHEGHLSLVKRSVSENDRTVVSVLVNPTQFDDKADLAAYPRDLARDTALLESAGVDAILAPTPEAIYPDGYRFRVTERGQSERREGAHRPGHFDGVLTVVLKLLLLTDPDRAYMGEKDWQQLQLVTDMAAALFLRTEIVACPTVREPDGLAMSSRNVRLDPEARSLAAEFAATLRAGLSSEEVRRQLEEAGIEVDYVEVAGGRLLAAVRIGGVRLIDNVPV